MANAEKHTSSASEIVKPNSSMGAASVYASDKSGGSSVRQLADSNPDSGAQSEHTEDLQCGETVKLHTFDQFRVTEKFGKKPDDQLMRCTKDSSGRSSLPAMRYEQPMRRAPCQLNIQHSSKSSGSSRVDQRSKQSSQPNNT